MPRASCSDCLPRMRGSRPRWRRAWRSKPPFSSWSRSAGARPWPRSGSRRITRAHTPPGGETAGTADRRRPLATCRHEGRPMERDETFETGLEIRKEMFGALTVEHLENVDDFMRDLQDMVTKYCFGEVWGREGLGRNVRSMITLSLLAAQGRGEELRWHVKGALANGV